MTVCVGGRGWTSELDEGGVLLVGCGLKVEKRVT